MQEGIAIYGNFGVILYSTGIATTQNTEDGEVRNALRVIEDIHVVLCAHTLAAMRAGELFGVIIHFSVIFVIFSLHVDGNIGASHAGVLTISSAENREMRVLVVFIRFLPFRCFQKRIWSHTLLYNYRGKVCYVAGKFSAAIDVMRVEELVLIFVIESCFLYGVVFSFLSFYIIVPSIEFLLVEIP